MLEVLRDTFLKERTFGEMYLDGDFLCDTLEDAVRDGEDKILQKEEKIYGQTAIPTGTYQVIITKSERFKRDMPLLLKVPFFEGIRIHNGNTEAMTLGCILVGERNTKLTMVLNSINTFEKVVMPRIRAALEKGKLYLEVRNA